MIWLRTWKLGVKSLALHPLRTVLTMLGIMIGVTAVIVLTAISQGASRNDAPSQGSQDRYSRRLTRCSG